MNWDKWITLAEKFWLGETTPAEEHALKTTLQRADVPVELHELEAYFAHMENAKQTNRLGDAFDAHLLAQLSVPTPAKKRSLRLMGIRMAAGLVLLMGLTGGIYWQYGGTSSTQQADAFIDTFDDPEQAYAEVRKALMVMSNQLNAGMKHTETVGMFHQVQEQLKEN